MINSRYSMLSNKERDYIISTFLSDKNIYTDFSLSDEEILKIKKFDRHYVCLGYALQYMFLKNRGISILNDYDLIPQSIINHISLQLSCSHKDLKKYFQIKNTKYRHFQEIINILYKFY